MKVFLRRIWTSKKDSFVMVTKMEEFMSLSCRSVLKILVPSK